jgi:hypothetical protein
MRVAIVYPGNAEVRRNATPANNRFADLFRAFVAEGIHAEPAVYHDDFCDAVMQQLLQVDVVLVWVNPIEDGCDRTRLDAMLREVAAAGIFVSAHPDIILKLGTKEVLFQTRELGWGCDTHIYRSLNQMRQELPARLANGQARVLKQYRGHSGYGVWKVSLLTATPATPKLESLVCVRHAQRGSSEVQMPLREFFEMCGQYFYGAGRMIDQEYQVRLPEGMVRCYLTHGQVVGLGLQAINALYPAPPGAPASEAPQPGPRLYYPPTLPEFQRLKQLLEQRWLPAAQQLLKIETAQLPIIWDCDFLLGPKTSEGEDSYVLCEINVSSVAPYPESAVPFIVKAVLAQLPNAR